MQHYKLCVIAIERMEFQVNNERYIVVVHSIVLMLLCFQPARQVQNKGNRKTVPLAPELGAV